MLTGVRCDGEPSDPSSGPLQLPLVIEQALPRGYLYRDPDPASDSTSSTLPLDVEPSKLTEAVPEGSEEHVLGSLIPEGTLSHPSMQDVQATPQTNAASRRAQSDAASAEIGRRLLKGWTMLGDTCPNPSCYGVPLMTAPKGKDSAPVAEGGPSGTTEKTGRRRKAVEDPRRWCVACGQSFVHERDAAKLERFEEGGIKTEAAPPAAKVQAAPLSSVAAPVARTKRPSDGVLAESNKRVATAKHAAHTQPASPEAVDAAILAAQRRLETSLQRLTDHLNALNEAAILNPAAISETASALGVVVRTIQALSA